jgi:S-formylglutathione hydrolase FrmB
VTKLLTAFLVATAVIAAACSSPSSTTMADATGSATPLVAADDGASIAAIATLDARTRDLTIASPAVGTEQVRLLLPAGFTARSSLPLPVLYLLHGGSGEYTDWTLNTDVEGLTAASNVLVVMPAGASSGVDGWYTDWVANGKDTELDHAPAWETFHLTELRELLERNFDAGSSRAVAGLSMGGYGAIVYAGRHPGFFRAAASYSGALDLRAEVADEPNPDATAIWGDPVADSANWDTHDPLSLVPELRGTVLYVSYGDGNPGPLDPAGSNQDRLETQIGEGNARFVAALRTARIPATVDAYGAGTHTWPYWSRELGDSLPILLAALRGSGS